MRRDLDLELAQKAVHEYELLIEAKLRRAEWQRITALWGN